MLDPIVVVAQVERLRAEMNTKSSGGKRRCAVFDSSGTWIPPDGVEVVDMLLVGGGAGGGAGAISNYTPNATSGGRGGGSGGYMLITDVHINGAVSIVVGAGGSGGKSSSTQGGNGGETTVTFAGRSYRVAGGYGSSSGAVVNGVAAGSESIGLNIVVGGGASGGAGATYIAQNTVHGKMSGLAKPGSSTLEMSQNAPNAGSGYGGGGGFIGAGGNGAVYQTGEKATPATGYGGGGGGGAAATQWNSERCSGSDGAPGVVMIYWWE